MRSDIENYTLDGYDLDEYGTKDPFRKLIIAMVRKVLSKGKWFAFVRE